MRVWTGVGTFNVRFDPHMTNYQTIRDAIVVTHDGPLELEVVDVAVRARVLALAIYDLMRQFPKQVGEVL